MRWIAIWYDKYDVITVFMEIKIADKNNIFLVLFCKITKVLWLLHVKMLLKHKLTSTLDTQVDKHSWDNVPPGLTCDIQLHKQPLLDQYQEHPTSVVRHTLEFVCQLKVIYVLDMCAIVCEATHNVISSISHELSQMQQCQWQHILTKTCCSTQNVR